VPFILAALVFVHIVALHKVGSNNPTASRSRRAQGQPLEPHGPGRRHPFHPYYSVKDIVGVVGFFILFLAVVFFAPDFFATSSRRRTSSREPAEDPVHIAPVWYFTPFYAMLRAVPSFAARRSGACW